MAFIKGVLWIVLILIISPIDFWILFGSSLLAGKIETALLSLVQSGISLFFLASITTSITIDYHFDENKSQSGNLMKSLAFTFYPLIVCLSCLIIYFFSVKDSFKNITYYSIANKYLFALTIVYAIITKTYLFYSSKPPLQNLMRRYR